MGGGGGGLNDEIKQGTIEGGQQGSEIDEPTVRTRTEYTGVTHRARREDKASADRRIKRERKREVVWQKTGRRVRCQRCFWEILRGVCVFGAGGLRKGCELTAQKTARALSLVASSGESARPLGGRLRQIAQGSEENLGRKQQQQTENGVSNVAPGGARVRGLQLG